MGACCEFRSERFNLGSQYLHTSGSDSPKLNGFVAPHLATANYSSSQLDISSLSQSAHAFNLAAFRSPGFLNAHGFAFGGNFGYREHSPGAFDSNQLSVPHHGSGGGGGGPGNVGFNNNSNSPTNQYGTNTGGGRTGSPTRDRYLSDYYTNHNNNTNKKLDHRTSDYNNSSVGQQQTNSGGDINSDNNRQNNHGSYGRSESESPELQTRSSPVDSSRSFPSQKSDEPGFHSPHHDSIGSRSPENLSGKKQTDSNNMLDHHKLPLSFLGPPLAALHSMTEMKSNGHQQHQTTQGSHGAPNPHGIDTILSRPPPVTSAGLNALTNGE